MSDVNCIQCCSPQFEGGGAWGVLNALTGWTNSATYNSVLAYNMYWVFVISMFLMLRFKELHGRLPFMKKAISAEAEADGAQDDGADSDGESEPRQSRDSTRALLPKRDKSAARELTI